MVDSTNVTPDETVYEGVVVETPTRLQSFVNKHPRAARALAITGVLGTVIGAACVTKTLAANRSHLDAAGDHLAEAAHELSTSVTPQSPEA